jgi:hypothetical protein
MGEQVSKTTPPAVFGSIALVLTGAVLPQEVHAGVFLPAVIATVAAAALFVAVAAVLVIENKNGGK